VSPSPRRDNTLTVGSLFAGIGGFDLGFERAGFEVLWQVEKDARKRAVLAERWPGVERFEDIQTVEARDLATVDVLTAGFPCEDNASCGRRAGLAGAQSGLWFEIPRLLRGATLQRPRWLLLENPPGVLKRGLHRILADLAGLGFDAEWDVLPAAAFGAHQLRARIWILAYPCGYREQAHDTVFAGRSKFDGDGRWPTEPALDRVADGFPGWMVGALGDAVCPPIAQWIAERIKDAEAQRRGDGLRALAGSEQP
jgi:DNA (cytosine-5)-methyltransferase 1